MSDPQRNSLRDCIACRFCRMRTAVKIAALILAGVLIALFFLIRTTPGS